MREVISLGILPLYASNTGCGLCKTFPKFHVCISGVRKRNLWKNNLLARVEWVRASLWVDKIAHPQNKGPSQGVSAGFPQGSNLRSRSLLRLCTVDTTKISSLTPKGKRCRALRDPPVLHRHYALVLGYFSFQACGKQSLSPETQQEPASRDAPWRTFNRRAVHTTVLTIRFLPLLPLYSLTRPLIIFIPAGP